MLIDYRSGCITYNNCLTQRMRTWVNLRCLCQHCVRRNVCATTTSTGVTTVSTTTRHVARSTTPSCHTTLSSMLSALAPTTGEEGQGYSRKLARRLLGVFSAVILKYLKSQVTFVYPGMILRCLEKTWKEDDLTCLLWNYLWKTFFPLNERLLNVFSFCLSTTQKY